MSKTYSPKRFTNIGLLRKLDFPLLIRLLLSHKEFFEAQPNFFFTNVQAEFPYPVLCQIMLNLGKDAPAELLETLYFIEFFGRMEFYDDLLEVADKNQIPIESSWTPSDLAMQVWFECEEEIHRLHAALHRRGPISRPKRYESFFVRGEIRKMRPYDDTTIALIQNELEQWAQKTKRGLGMRLFVFDEGDSVCFMLRHGQPLRRENTVEEDGSDGCVFFRPEKYDTMIYYPATGEFATGVKTKKERFAYSQVIGSYFFGKSDYFEEAGCHKYTLSPLLNRGADALYCFGHPVIESVTLTELHFTHNHQPDNTEHRRCPRGLFEEFVRQGRDITAESPIEINKAKLVLSFHNRQKTAITIQVPNIATYDRENYHEVIHRWLVEHGFIIKHQREGVFHDESHKILANA